MTPNRHEKLEWARLASEAYARHYNRIGHIYSAAAAAPEMCAARFDLIQAGYRNWLVFGDWPEAEVLS